MWSTIDPTDEEIEAAGPWGEALPTLVFNKYDEFTKDAINNSTGTVTTYRFMVPLIRLSEMYLIAAESSPNTTEALELINTLRLHRNCRDLPADTDIDRAITYEMAREVIGEGQLFYFYKRRAMTEIISGTSIDGKYNMQLSNYTLPLPDSEIEERNISNL
nr:RagB/SusD family nutrient uptake outer membrane protein [uncultured Duncaniella sp.]